MHSHRVSAIDGGGALRSVLDCCERRIGIVRSPLSRMPSRAITWASAFQCIRQQPCSVDFDLAFPSIVRHEPLVRRKIARNAFAERKTGQPAASARRHGADDSPASSTPTSRTRRRFYSQTGNGTGRRQKDRDWPTLQLMLQQFVSAFDAHMGRMKKDNSDLNRLRGDIPRPRSGEGPKPRGLFTLTMPTGGGKTRLASDRQGASPCRAPAAWLCTGRWSSRDDAEWSKGALLECRLQDDLAERQNLNRQQSDRLDPLFWQP